MCFISAQCSCQSYHLQTNFYSSASSSLIRRSSNTPLSSPSSSLQPHQKCSIVLPPSYLPNLSNCLPQPHISATFSTSPLRSLFFILSSKLTFAQFFSSTENHTPHAKVRHTHTISLQVRYVWFLVIVLGTSAWVSRPELSFSCPLFFATIAGAVQAWTVYSSSGASDASSTSPLGLDLRQPSPFNSASAGACVLMLSWSPPFCECCVFKVFRRSKMYNVLSLGARMLSLRRHSCLQHF